MITHTRQVGEPPADRAWIELREVRKTFYGHKVQPVEALKPCSFTVNKGEFLTIVGPSGCGKTTILNMIAGLIPSTGGEIVVAGKAVKGPQSDIGMVFQAATLLPWRTILQNIMLPAEIQGLDKAHFTERAHTLLEMVGLEKFSDRLPSELSGGMQQRAGICRALLHDPDVLLMDEPFGALDAMTRDTMNMELLRIWQTSGKTIILITHGISEAVFLADRVVVMAPRPGRVEEIIDVELPRPRELSMLHDPILGKHVEHIRSKLTSLAPASGIGR